MKRVILNLVILVCISQTTSAQVNPHAIGIRGGLGLGGYGGEISYQHGFGEKNRLELDLGWRNYHYDNGKGNDWRYSHMAFTGIYHWDWNITEGLNWYIGPGAQLGFYNDYYDNNSGVSLAIGGQIGLEYDFNQHGVPLLLGFDARPMWDFIGYYAGVGAGGAFSLRYTF